MKNAFTLVELMIVIVIIIILAVAGTGAYSAARQRLIPDIEADKIIAMLNTLRSTAKSSALCEGVIFEKNGEMQITEAPYINPSQPCGQTRAQRASFSKSVSLTKIMVDEAEHDTLQLQFIPPQGNIDFSLEGGQTILTIAATNAPENFKTIIINKQSGVIEKK